MPAAHGVPGGVCRIASGACTLFPVSAYEEREVTMDTVDVMSAFDELAATMRAMGYLESTIEVNRKSFSRLSKFTEGGRYTAEAGRAYVESGWRDGRPHVAQHRRVKERTVSLIEGYIANGRFDLAPKPGRLPAIPEGAGLVRSLAEFEAAERGRGIADSTIAKRLDCARRFLRHAEGDGIVETDEIGPEHVLGFMCRMRTERRGTDQCSIASSLRAYLRHLRRVDLVDALKMVKSTRSHPVIEVLDDGDEEAITRACCDRLVTAKDAAITLLALTTGLRSVDIANLRLGDVCWRSMTISIIQHKTSNPVVLPMRPAVADAIGEYVLEERPDGGGDHLFLRSRAPYTATAISTSGVYGAIGRAFAAAGVDGAGTRILRRNAATKMLRAGAAAPVISAVLGHADPRSTGAYMELDSAPMRACVLPLPEGVRSWL